MSHGHGCVTPANTLMDKSQSSLVTAAAVDVGSGPLLGVRETIEALNAIVEDVARGRHEPDSLVALASKSALAVIENMNDRLNAVREYGEVYVYPSGWRCSKMGGPPDIDAYEKVDLSEA